MRQIANLVLMSLLWGSGAAAQPTPMPLPDGDDPVARDTDATEETVFDTGGELGYARLDSLNYVVPTPAADIRLDFFQAAVRIPLRLETGSFDIRSEDWDETSDYLRVGQCVRMDWSSEGRFEREHGLCLPWDVHRDDYYFSVRLGPVYDYTLGHGTVLRAYSSNLNPDHYRAGAVGKLQFHQFVRSEFLIDNVTRPELVGATVGFRPFGYEVEQTEWLYEYRHNFQINATAVSDLGAPADVRTAFGRALTDEAGNLLYRVDPVTVVSGDIQYRFVFGEQIELEARVDWNWIVEQGMGGHGQIWFIYNHPDWVYSVRGIGEFRYIQDDYIPNYFDSYYLIQRQQYGLTEGAQDQLDRLLSDDQGVFTTKQEYLAALPEEDWRAGYLGGIDVELYRSAEVDDQRRTAVRFRLFISDTFSREDDGQFLATLEIPRLSDDIDVYALYSRQNFDDIVDIFQLEDTLVKVLVRWDLNEQFYLLMNYGRIWQLQVDDAGMSVDGFQSNNEVGLSVGFTEDLASDG